MNIARYTQRQQLRDQELKPGEEMDTFVCVDGNDPKATLEDEFKEFWLPRDASSGTSRSAAASFTGRTTTIPPPPSSASSSPPTTCRSRIERTGRFFHRSNS